MKQIKCEMCGSNDLLKEDGTYVCQACGTKYSIEEAKKLIVEVEGNVDVSGSTVKIDNVEEIADAINEQGNRGAKTKVRFGLILSALTEFICLFIGPILYFIEDENKLYLSSFASSGLAIACICAFVLSFAVTVFFITKPEKMKFTSFCVFILTYAIDIILTCFISGFFFAVFILFVLWLPMISKNYNKIK